MKIHIMHGIKGDVVFTDTKLEVLSSRSRVVAVQIGDPLAKFFSLGCLRSFNIVRLPQLNQYNGWTTAISQILLTAHVGKSNKL